MARFDAHSIGIPQDWQRRLYIALLFYGRPYVRWRIGLYDCAAVGAV